MLQRIEAQRKSFKRNKGIRIIAFQKAKLSTTYELVYCHKPKFEAIQRFVKPQRHRLRHSYALFQPIVSLLPWLPSNRSDSPLLKIWSNFRSSRPQKKPNNLPICRKTTYQLSVIDSEEVFFRISQLRTTTTVVTLTLTPWLYKCLVWN